MKLKTKYERMTKEEKKKLYKEYKLEKKEIAKKMERMFLLVYIGIGYSLLMIVMDIIKKSTLAYSLDIVLLVFCLVSLWRLIVVKKELLNKFILNKTKKRKGLKN